MKKQLVYILCILVLISGNVGSLQGAGKVQKAKYVFLFIGDGMGLAHVSITEAYLATQKGEIGNEPMLFSTFPVTGLVTTYSASNFITCSSAAGTALSTGSKTKNNMLCVDSLNRRLTSICYKIKAKGIPVGIMTTVSIDHATPAAFYAYNTDRDNYYEIAVQLPASGFDFFGGGGFIYPRGAKKDKPFIYDIIKNAGYKVAHGIEDMPKTVKGDKVVLVQKDTAKSELPLAIDRKRGDLSLKEIVNAAINCLDGKKGFFIMAEGGQIDWTAHSNNPKSTIIEILDMDEAVRSAYEFYLKHPDETLIIVTADHETGGLSVGRKSGYNLNLKALDKQTSSNTQSDYNAESYKTGSNAEIYDKLNEEALIGWTTRSHTGIMVPLFAIGAGSDQFTGRMDNTEIPRKICRIMGINF
jgi:alkaline phosphatase